MKKTVLYLPGLRRLAFKAILFMKLTTAFILAACLHASANGFSQRIDLQASNVLLTEVFKKIEDRTSIRFVYSKDVVQDKVLKKVCFRRTRLDEALKQLLADFNLSYKMVNDSLVAVGEPVLENNAVAEKIKVSGKVTDETGNPLAGVSIRIRGSSDGTTTNNNGEFYLEVEKDDFLEISYVDHAPQLVSLREKAVNDNRITVSVMLRAEAKEIDQVVLIGYGTTKRKDVTGAISSIKATTIPKSANTSIEQALSGRAAGLMAVQSSGQPGAGVSVQIRGNASFASSGVLYVVDGVPVNGGAGEPGSGTRYGGIDRSPLNFINPEDIESIEVLKDASSAAIYGARAGAGVILITTKRGKTGEAMVNYNFSHAFQEPAKFYEILNKHDYMVERNRITKEKWMADNGIAPYGTTDPSTIPAFVPKFTQVEIANAGEGQNALEQITQSGFLQQHNLSISGGNLKTKYYVSGNYLNQDGVIKTSAYKRYSGRVNLDQMIGEKIKVGISMTTSKSFSDNPAIGTGQFENSGIILSAFYHPPTVPLVAADGSYPLNPDYSNSPNPVSFLETTDKTVLNRLLTTTVAEWEIIKDLKAKANFSYDQSSSKRSTYLPKSFLYGARTGGQANISENTSNIGLLEYTLAYSRKINNAHNLNGLAGYSYQVLSGEGFNAGNQQFLTDNFLYNSLGVGEFAKPSVGSYKSKQVWASYFARAGYDYSGKYLLQASIRRDGSSNFAENKKYGWFPSVSAGWKISSENFMRHVSAVSFLKLRASYGTTGNSNIGGNAFPYYSAGSNYVFGNTELIGVYQSQLANPDLSWETAREVNLGVDFGLLKDRISGSFEVFNKIISDLLSSRPLPSFSVVSSVAANIGKTQSRGFEFSLKTVNIDKKNFSWRTDFNIGHFKDTWKERDSLVVKTMRKYIGLNDPIRAIYGYETDGILQVGEKVPEHMTGLKPGMVKVKDLNGYDANGNLTGQPDGKLSTADAIYLGNSDPGFTFGFGNTFRYKNFDLNIFMYGMLDRLKYNDDKASAYNLYSTMGSFGWNALAMVKDRWASDNAAGTNPSGIVNPYGSYAGNYFREKGDFLKCRNITLGYTFSNNILGGQKIVKGLRVYADAQNLFTITKYSGLDPELSSFIAYPAQRSFILGANVSF